MNVKIGQIAEVRQGMSRSGRSAGARAGEAEVRLVSGSDIQDDRLVGPYMKIRVAVDELTHKHLLRPYDVVVTGKSTAAKAALVPEDLGPAVANSTLVVLRPDHPDVTAFLWWFLTSKRGRAVVESRMVASATLSFLPPRVLAEIEVSAPVGERLHKFANLVLEGERAYRAAREAAELRRDILRNRLLPEIIADSERMEA